MAINLRSTYRVSDEFSQMALIALFVLIVAALFGIVFLSPTLVFAIVLATITVFVTFFRPQWSLAFLLLFLPFEPFLLKWISDDVYVYARFFSESLVYLLVASTMWKLATAEKSLKASPIDLPFILFLVVLGASAIINFVEPTDALLGARQIVRFMLLFFVTLYLAPTRTWMRNLFFGLLIVVCVQVFLGYAQFIFGEPVDQFLIPSESRTFGEIQLTSGTVQFWDPGQRVFGTVGRYDRLGVFMAFIMLIATSFLYEPKMRKYHPHLIAFLVASLPILVLTYSRSAWFGFLLGFLFMALWAKRDKRVAIVVGISTALITIYLAVSGLLINQLIDVPQQSVVERFFEAFSYERWRGEYYGLGRLYWIVQTVTTVVPASPVFGHGPAMYGAGAVAALHNTVVYDQLSLPFGVYGTEGYIDNNWFSLWGEVGTLGLLIYLWLYIGLFVACVRVWKKSEQAFTRALALGVAAAMLAVALNAFLATFLEVRTLAPYLWVFSALVILLGLRENLIKT